MVKALEEPLSPLPQFLQLANEDSIVSFMGQ